MKPDAGLQNPALSALSDRHLGNFVVALLMIRLLMIRLLMMRVLMTRMLMTRMLLVMASIVRNLTRVVALSLLLHAVQHQPPLRVPLDLLLSLLPNRVNSW